MREILFLEAASLPLLGEHRVERPYGMEGGVPGAAGAQRILRADGMVEVLPGHAAVEVRDGDRLVVETPGGGGWGAATRAAT